MAPPRGVFLFQSLALKRLGEVPGVKLSFLFHPIVEGVEGFKTAKADLYRWWRNTWHHSRGLAPLEASVKLSRDFPNLHPMPLEFERHGEHAIRLTSEGEELLELLEIDALLNFNTFILRGSILEAFPHGVWSYHHGDPLRYRGSPPGFWEIFDESRRSGAILQRLSEKLDDGEVLREADLPTIAHDYCLQKQALFAASVPWPAEVAEEILRTGRITPKRSGNRSASPIRRRPTNLHMLGFLIPYLKAKLRRHTVSAGRVYHHKKVVQ